MLAVARWAVDPDAALGRPLGIVVLVKAAVDQMALGPAAMAPLQALEHRAHQPAVRAAGQNSDADPDLAPRHGGDLAVGGRPQTPAAPLPVARPAPPARGPRPFLLGVPL